MWKNRLAWDKQLCDEAHQAAVEAEVVEAEVTEIMVENTWAASMFQKMKEKEEKKRGAALMKQSVKSIYAWAAERTGVSAFWFPETVFFLWEAHCRSISMEPRREITLSDVLVM